MEDGNMSNVSLRLLEPQNKEFVLENRQEKLLMRNAILWATLWTILAIGSAFYLLQGTSERWFDIGLTLASLFLAFISWREVRELYRETTPK